MIGVTRVLELEDLDELFKSRPRPIVLNDMPITTESNRHEIDDLVITTYDKTDSLSSVPSCACGKKKFGFREGIICEYCDTVVTVVTKRELKPDVFIRAPEQVGKLLNPMVWMMLHKGLDMSKGKGTNGLRWITDRRAVFGNHTKRIKEFIDAFNATGLERGYSSFINNFDQYFSFILSCIKNVRLRHELHDVMVTYGDKIFCQYLPIPSKVAMVVEKTHVGTYYDKIIDAVIEAVYTAASLSSFTDQQKVETRISTIQELLGKYYRDLFPSTIASKPGLLRRDCYGAKVNFSFRNIITSQHEPHYYNQIQLPYSMALIPLQPAVINVLCNKHNMSYKEAYNYTETHSDDMDPLILSILNEFARTANGGLGIMISLTR